MKSILPKSSMSAAECSLLADELFKNGSSAKQFMINIPVDEEMADQIARIINVSVHKST